MDYLKTYSLAFSKISYSSDHHIQYDYAISQLLYNFDIQSTFTCIDIGSGRGQLIKMIKDVFPNSIITSVDLEKFNNENVNFKQCNLSNANERNSLTTNIYDVLCCTDVFEHLDKSFIEDVIQMCSILSNKCVLAIANHSDVQNGIELHTIQENDNWWDSYLTKYFIIEKKEMHYDGRLYMYFCTKK
jgi:trans-aconitate methyltransferase